MEVRIENNPMISRIWNEWMEKDKELSSMTREERLGLCERYQWLYPKRKNMVDLESQYGVHQRSNREELKKWFYVVSSHLFSRVHLGENSYYSYKKVFKQMFKRDKVTSDDFPSQILLVLAMLGYVVGLRAGYRYSPNDDRNHGYPFIIDKEKLLDWGDSASADGFFVSVSNTKIPIYVMNTTSPITFYENEEDEVPEKTSWSQHPDWFGERQFQTISSIEVLEDGIMQSSGWIFNFNDYKEYYTLSSKEKEDIKDEWHSYQELRNLSCHIVGECKEDNYAGRFYNPICYMRAEHRHKFLRLGGELISEVDVSSAQPTFLGLYMCRTTGVVSEWLKQCLAGSFYEWVKEQTNANADRDTIKKWMMRYLYACYQADKGKDYPNSKRRNTNGGKDKAYVAFKKKLDKFLKENEPAIYKKIDWHKRNPVYREDKDSFMYYVDEMGNERKKKKGEGKWCSTLSCDLVGVEVEYIKKCIRALPQETLFYTIHDCICVPESKAIETRSIMEDVSREMFGFTLKLKVENTSLNYS